MSISSISFGNTPINTQNWQSIASQQQRDFQSLASSLQSGNLSGAQQSYSDLQTLAPANASSPSSAFGTSAVQQDFTALGKDLSAGNLSQARKDFTQMKNDFQLALSQNGGASGLRQHGHHGHRVEAPPAQSATSLSANSTLSSAASSLFSPYASANSTGNSLASTTLSLMG